MKLQKQSVGKIKNKEYSKYVIVLPSKAIKELQWKEGEELKAEVRENKLIISL
jgi:bifunctional DNA-binding transcriptional regulator/antitoxin component of YhaV-PrlF toxin-antitoxin module